MQFHFCNLFDQSLMKVLKIHADNISETLSSTNWISINLSYSFKVVMVISDTEQAELLFHNKATDVPLSSEGVLRTQFIPVGTSSLGSNLCSGEALAPLLYGIKSSPTHNSNRQCKRGQCPQGFSNQ